MRAMLMACALTLSSQSPPNSSWDIMMKPYSSKEAAEFKSVANQATGEARRFFEQRFGAVETTTNSFGCKITTGIQTYDQPHASMIGHHTHSIREEGPAPGKLLFTLNIERRGYPHQVATPQRLQTAYGTSYVNELQPPDRDFQIFIIYDTTKLEDLKLFRELETALLAPFVVNESQKDTH